MQMYALFRVKGKISEKKIKEISTRLFFERFFSFLCIILLPLPLYKTLNMDRRTFFKTTLFAAGGMAVGGLTSCEEPAKTYDEKTGMTYRRLGRTGIDVSVVALGCEGFSKKSAEEVRAEFDHAINRGVNFLDLYSSNPDLRSNIGYALKGRRNKFVVQGHIGSTWENGQYLRTRDVEKVKVAFEDLLERLGTNYIDVGMIHYVDERADYDTVMNGPFFDYVRWLKKKRKIRSIGLSTHSVEIATLAAESGIVDVLMFSLSPGYDLTFENGQIVGISPERAQLYELCAKNGVAIDVMKAFGGGNLLIGMDCLECNNYSSCYFKCVAMTGAGMYAYNYSAPTFTSPYAVNYAPTTTFGYMGRNANRDGNVLTYNFDDGTLQGWTTIDADGDGINWFASSSHAAHSGSYAAVSQSYRQVLYPNNYLVSPQVRFTNNSTFTFWATDGNDDYGAEHFGVAVSTNGSTGASDFTTVSEWTLLSKDWRKTNGRCLVSVRR